MKYYSISHKACDDGSASTAIVKKFKPEAIVILTGYDEAWKKTEYVNGDYILFSDFHPDPAELWELYEKGVTFNVLDHHISSINIMNEYRKNHPDRALILEPLCHFDQTGKCGATMTWDWFAKDQPQPSILKYIEIADTWAWERDPDAKYVTQYIRTITKQGSWEDMAKLLDTFDPTKALEHGKILMQRLENDVEAICKKAHVLYIDGMEVLSVNSGHDLSISEVGHALAEKAENNVGLVYNIAYNEVKISVRGKKGTTIARELCEKLGGGGHNEAGGARSSIKKFMEYFKKPT